MSVSPSRSHGLWHPTRGIAFSLGPPSPITPVQRPRSVVGVSVDVSDYHTIASESIGTRSEAWTEAIIQGAALTPGAQPTLPSIGLQQPVTHKDGVASLQPAVEANEPERKTTDDPPPPVFEYKMVDGLFYAAKRAEPGSAGSFWSHRQYRRTAEDGSSQNVKVHYCCSKHKMEQVCRQYFMDEKVLGFDLEWVADSTKRDGLKKNVSLIQLASPSRIALFHVALFHDSEDMVGPSFRSLMEDPEVTKVGVAIKGDTTRLRNYLDIHSRGLMELSNLYKLVTHSRTRQYHNINRRLVTLATQVEQYLHLPLFKGQNVRSSDWSRRLDIDQVNYSASDAYAGLHLYATLEHHRKQLDPCPPPPRHAELNLAIQLAEGVKIGGPEDALEADEVGRSNTGTPASSERYLAAALETASVQATVTSSSDAVSKETKASCVSKEKPAQTIPAVKSLEQPKDSRVEVAEDRVASYRASHPQSRSSFSQLRAYYLWHCYTLSPAAVAQLVRDPPLKTITVVQYILSVVQSEKLPVDGDRLREAAAFFPQSTLWTRWPGVASRVSTKPDNFMHRPS